MKKISPDETVILGSTMSGGKMIVDREACLRINWLTSEALENVGVRKDSGGWERLYRDPVDGRYWHLTYPHGEMQGGGPPELRHILLSAQDIGEKYVSAREWADHAAKFMRENDIRFIPSKR